MSAHTPLSEKDFARLSELVCAQSDGTITDRETEELDRLLTSSPAAVDAFVLMSSTLADLAERSIEQDVRRKGDDATADNADEGDRGKEAVQPVRRTNRVRQLLKNEWGIGVAVAVLFTVTIVSILALTPLSSMVTRSKEGGDNPAPVAPKEIATLTAWHRPEWVKEHAISPRNHRVTAGQTIAFTSGLIEITYDTGARVVIEGPAEFVAGGIEAEGGREGNRHQGTQAQRKGKGERIKDKSEIARSPSPYPAANSGFLKLGRLVALCDTPRSQGFTIHSPRAHVVDLGTEFGVEVDERGSAEVSVLAGKVELIGGEDSQQRILLTKGQGAFVAADSGKITAQQDLDAGRFAAVRKRLESIGDTLGAGGVTITSGGTALDEPRWVTKGFGQYGHVFFDGESPSPEATSDSVLTRGRGAKIRFQAVSGIVFKPAADDAVAIENELGTAIDLKTGAWMHYVTVPGEFKEIVRFAMDSTPSDLRIGVLLGAGGTTDGTADPMDYPTQIRLSDGRATLTHAVIRPSGLRYQADWYFFDVRGITSGTVLTVLADGQSTIKTNQNTPVCGVVFAELASDTRTETEKQGGETE
ncbi:MAG: FecR domain-containing protein [Pirellulales bacterium]|nr:FecR domain-containing protein [Pirellulales bacterium]